MRMAKKRNCPFGLFRKLSGPPQGVKDNRSCETASTSQGKRMGTFSLKFEAINDFLGTSVRNATRYAGCEKYQIVPK